MEPFPSGQRGSHLPFHVLPLFAMAIFVMLLPFLVPLVLFCEALTADEGKNALATGRRAAAAGAPEDLPANPSDNLLAALGLRYRRHQDLVTFESMTSRAYEIMLQISTTSVGKSSGVLIGSVAGSVLVVIILVCACLIATYDDEDEGAQISGRKSNKSKASMSSQDQAQHQQPIQSSQKLAPKGPTPKDTVHTSPSEPSQGPTPEETARAGSSDGLLPMSQHLADSWWTGEQPRPSLLSAAVAANREGTTNMTRTEALLSRIEARMNAEDSEPTAPATRTESAPPATALHLRYGPE